MNVRVACEMQAGGVVRYVLKLGEEVGQVANAMLVITGVPDFSGRLLAHGEGVATFDELEAAGGALIARRCDEGVGVIGQHSETVELELPGVSISEKRADEELGVDGSLEVTMALEGEDRDGVGALRLANGGHGGEHTPGAKAPALPGWWEGQG